MGAQNDTQEIFDNEEENQEMVEIGPDGRVYKPGDAPKANSEKPLALRDPHGEYKIIG